MSGGHYDYQYYHINNLADWLEKDFLNNGQIGEYNYLNDASEPQKQQIIQEVNSLINDLRKCAQRAREIEWYMSGDTGANTYLERLSKIL